MKTIFTLIAAEVLPTDTDINAPQKERDKGEGASCYELGVLYDSAKEGAARDYQKAAELYCKAYKPVAAGCSNLGFYTTPKTA